MMAKKIFIAASALIFLACSTAQESQQLYDKASALTKLAAHVDAAILYSPAGKSESDQALFEKAFADNPRLKSQLGADELRLMRGERGIVLLVCTKDDLKALLEDLSCTPQMDKHRWREGPDLY